MPLCILQYIIIQIDIFVGIIFTQLNILQKNQPEREMIMKVIIDNHGSRSCQAWIDNLEKTDRITYRKLKNDLVYLEMFGKEMLKGGNKPQSIKPLTDADGIWQIRIDDHRVLFFYYESNSIVVTNGFTKKRATTPKGEIKKAKSIKNLYL